MKSVLYSTYRTHNKSAQRYTDITLTIKCKIKAKIKPADADTSLLVFHKSNCKWIFSIDFHKYLNNIKAITIVLAYLSSFALLINVPR